MYRRQRALGLALIGLFWIAQYSFGPIFTPYMSELGISDGMIGIIVGAYGLTQTLVRIPLGIASDRVGKRRPFVFASLLLAAAAGVGLFYSRGAAGFLAFRALSGVVSAAWVPLSLLIVAAYPPEQTGRALAQANAANSVGQLIATLGVCTLCGWLFSARATFLASTLFALLGAALCLRVREEASPRQPLRLGALLRLPPRVLWASLLGLLHQFVIFSTVQSFLPLRAKDLHASVLLLGLLSSLYMIPNIAAMLLGSRAMEKGFFGFRLRMDASIRIGFLLLAVAALCVAYAPTLPLLLLSTLLLGFGSGLEFPFLMTRAVIDMPPEKRGAAMGFYQSVYGLGMTFGPVFTGWLSEHFSLQWGLAASSGIALLAMLLCFLEGFLLRDAPVEPTPL